MEFIVIWGIFAIVAGVIASNKNRSVFGWVLLSLLLSPLVILILLALPSLGQTVREIDEYGNVRALLDTKVCPQCAEEVKYKAKVCRFCGHSFTGGEAMAEEVPRDDEQARLDRAAGGFMDRRARR